MRPVYLSLMWHMHQPYYRDPLSKEASLPWVRLHSTKDYLDMVLLLEEYPGVKATFNLVPSLLLQIEEFTHQGLSDSFLDLSRRKAADLSREERVKALKWFFMANVDRMIRPHPRYLELYLQRGQPASDRDWSEAARQFSTQDFLDLQVWFNLAWYDPYLVYLAGEPELRRLVKKRRGYTEEDKESLLALQVRTMDGIVPAYRRLQDAGQIEVTTSAFYHPILPLLCDTDIARQSQPSLSLPQRRFAHPEDAEAQLARATAFYRERFGRTPRGLWPPEGSVSEEALMLAARQGFAWAATDEEILAESTGHLVKVDGHGKVENPAFLYQPYRFERNGKAVDLLFRDHRLSDRIGFLYSQWDPRAAAADLVQALLQVQADPAAGEAPLVSVILDGENAWEHFSKDGLLFFQNLYESLSREPRIVTVTPSEYLSQHPAQASLSRIHPGSWINHNFRVWIGHEEDNLAWDYLSQARDALVEWQKRHIGQAEQEKAQRAWESIYIAEGSDWNWWYGDDHSSDSDDEFDRLFRLHLTNVYNILGLEVPKHLFHAIARPKDKQTYTAPAGLIHPVIDGQESDYYEWLAAGFFDTGRVGGSMHQARAVLRSFHFGYDLKNFYVRLDPWRPPRKEDFEGLGSTRFEVKFLSPADRTLKVSFRGEALGPVCEMDDENGRPLPVTGCSLAAGKVLEMAVPFDVLGYARKAEAKFLVLVFQEDRLLEYFPLNGPVAFQVPGEELEASHWSA
jgi:alpha-amylase/alpha-mannosidase (GH57 family)